MVKIDFEKFLINFKKSINIYEINKAIDNALAEQGLRVNENDVLERIEEVKENQEEKSPKFKEGDWVVANSSGNLFKILSVKDGLYKVLNEDGEEEICHCKTFDKNLRLFTIEDAEDGDVLADNIGIIIFKDIHEYKKNDYKCLVIGYYGDASRTRDFDVQEDDEYWGTLETARYLRPATKEERDILFQKMREAGYEWDAEKKQLYKIGNTNVAPPSFEEAQGEIKDLTDFEKAVKRAIIYYDYTTDKERYITRTATELLSIARDIIHKEQQ